MARVRNLLLYLAFALFSCSLLAQESIPDFLNNYDWLDQKGKSAWEKQLQVIAEADQLIMQSNNAYIEVYNVEKDASLSEKKKQAKKKKLEEVAFDLSTQSLLKYKDAYYELYFIVEKKITPDAESHPVFPEIELYRREADKKYEAAGKVETIDQQKILTEANENQLLAVEKAIVAITIPASDYKATFGDDNMDNETVINEEMYRMYQEYINQNDIVSPMTFDQVISQYGETMTLESFDEIMFNMMVDDYKTSVEQDNGMNDSFASETETESLENKTQTSAEGLETGRQGFEEQQAGGMVTYEQNYGNKIAESSSQKQSSPRDVSKASQSESTSQQDGYAEPKTVKSREIVYNQGADVEFYDANTGGPSGTGAIEYSDKPYSERVKQTEVSDASYSSRKVYHQGMQFRVQIAASRAPLSIAQINAIYKGGLSVMEYKEGDYYRYQISGGSLLTSAQKVCSNTGVDKAYILAYDNGERLDLADAAEKSMRFQHDIEQKGNLDRYNQINFSVQVAASRTRLSESQLNFIYSGNKPISLILEEGWYKYQILVGSNLEEAYSIREKKQSKQAFIVAYKNGKKQNLFKAIQEFKNSMP